MTVTPPPAPEDVSELTRLLNVVRPVPENDVPGKLVSVAVASRSFAAQTAI
jgi:hypothetical protein